MDTKSKIFECVQCNRWYATMQSLCNHKRIKHSSESDKHFLSLQKIVQNNCNFCNKLFIGKNSLVKHYKICKIKKAECIINDANNDVKNNAMERFGEFGEI